jgi:hypothetical protein
METSQLNPLTMFCNFPNNPLRPPPKLAWPQSARGCPTLPAPPQQAAVLCVPGALPHLSVCLSGTGPPVPAPSSMFDVCRSGGWRASRVAHSVSSYFQLLQCVRAHLARHISLELFSKQSSGALAWTVWVQMNLVVRTDCRKNLSHERCNVCKCQS